MVSLKHLSLLAVAFAAACGDPNPTSGSVVVTVDGLPTGAKAAVRLTGPNGYARTLEGTQTVDRLPPGDYALRVTQVEHLGALYSSDFGQQTISVSAGAVESRTVGYALSSGGVNITIDGLPAGSPARVTLTRPDGFSRAVVKSGLQTGLPVGVYTLEAETAINVVGDVFSPDVTSQNLNVAATGEPATADVSYTRTTGVLALDVTGLPTGLPFDPVTVTGPNGYFASAKGARSLHGLAPGTYTVRAASAAAGCPTMYVPSAAEQVVEVSTTSDAAAPITYVQGEADPADLNLSIIHAQVIQVTQDSANNVPMVANRAGLLRLYGLANQCNTSTPAIRVTFTNGTIITAPAAESSVRTLLAEGVLDATWNVTIPANEMQPGLGYFAEIDVANAVAESNETDNRYPAAGTKSINVMAIPNVGIRFVPIAQPQNGTPQLDSLKAEQYIAFSRRIHPTAAFDIEVAPVFNTSRNIKASGETGETWINLLQELEAARVASGSPRFFHGIVQVPYNGGIAGIGYIGGSTAITWHHLPSGSPTVAHELGHNFGQFHAPCGGPAGPDPNFPYAGGLIGKYGYDAATMTLLSPTVAADIMGYCEERPNWISDYMYKRMQNNLAARVSVPPSAGQSAGTSPSVPVLMVWGRIIDGQPVLEPAFETVAPVQSLPPGPNRIRAFTRLGAADVWFSSLPIADVPGDAEVFAFTIPLSALGGQPVDSLQLTARGRVARNRMSVALTTDPQLRVTRASARSARVRWDAARYPVVMVRDPRTGDVLSFARGGDATIVTDAPQLEVNVSNRVRSAKLVRPVQ